MGNVLRGVSSLGKEGPLTAVSCLCPPPPPDIVPLIVCFLTKRPWFEGEQVHELRGGRGEGLRLRGCQRGAPGRAASREPRDLWTREIMT